MYNFKYAFIFCLLFFLVFEVIGQQPTRRNALTQRGQNLSPDSVNDQGLETITPVDPETEDSLKVNRDILPSDTIENAASGATGDVQTTIKYSATDSIDLAVDGRTMYLYGDAKIKYGDIDLEANFIEINYLTNELSATGGVDSLGNPIGNPIFTDASGTYYTEGIKYNFKTRKAVISGVVTKQDDAFIHGDKIKKNEYDEVYISSAKYTTCDLPHPHYDIKARKLKMIPGDKIVSGPFHLRINEVPMPLGFAFGMFPAPKKKASGIIIPTYGEERRRGFFLRNGGYYFAINDYVDLALLGEIYTKGTRGLTIASNYRKRYVVDGSFNFNYLSQRLSENIEDSTVRNDFRLTWNHRPVSRNNRRFVANINAATSTYNQVAVLNPVDNLNSNINSNVSYSMPLGRIFNINVALRHQQDVRRNIVNMDLPNVSINMNRIYPFQNIGNNPNAFYKKIFFAQNFNYSRRVTNEVRERLPATGALPERDTTYYLPFNFETFPTLWRNASSSSSDPQPMRFSFPISTSFNAFRFFTVSPTITYTETWNFSRLNYSLDEETNQLVADPVAGFSRAFNTDANLTVRTILYGFYNPGIGNIKAIRHVMTPSLGFTYTPDYSQPIFGFYERIGIEGEHEEFMPRYRSSPQRGQAGFITFDLKNTVEMKVRTPKDTATVDKKIPLLDEFSVRTSYNVFATEFNLAPINVNARTRIFQNVIHINAMATLDPYLYENTPIEQQGETRFRATRINELRWNHGAGIGQITNANLNVNTDLNPKARSAATVRRPTAEELHNPDLVEPSPEYYVPWDVPWSLRVGYTLGYTRRGAEPPNTTQSVMFSGNLSLTEKWKIDFTSAFDMEKKQFVNPRIGIIRDLHCWELNFHWVPLGAFTSFNLSIHVKAPQLKDLAYKRQRSFQDHRSF